MDTEECGVEYRDTIELKAWGEEDPVRTIEIDTHCSLPRNHTPRDRHSDGEIDWKGDEDEE